MNYRSNLVLAVAMALTLIMPIALATDVFQFGGSTGGGGCDYYVGDTVLLPQSYTELTSYFDAHTGQGLYQYCVWSLNKDGVNIDGNYSSMTTGYCPTPQIEYTFAEAGEYSYNSTIIGLNLTGGVPGTPYIIDEVSEDYSVCYSPPDPMTLWDIIKSFICSVFPCFWFCSV